MKKLTPLSRHQVWPRRRPPPAPSCTKEPPTNPPQDTRPEPSQAQQDQDYREQLERCYAVAQASCMSDCIDKYHNSDKTCRQKLCRSEVNLSYWNRICKRDLARGLRY